MTLRAADTNDAAAVYARYTDPNTAYWNYDASFVPFLTLSTAQTVWVQEALVAMGGADAQLLQSSARGSLSDEATTDAIAAYQRARGLVPSGRLDHETFTRLLAEVNAGADAAPKRQARSLGLADIQPPLTGFAARAEVDRLNAARAQVRPGQAGAIGRDTTTEELERRAETRAEAGNLKGVFGQASIVVARVVATDHKQRMAVLAMGEAASAFITPPRGKVTGVRVPGGAGLPQGRARLEPQGIRARVDRPSAAPRTPAPVAVSRYDVPRSVPEVVMARIGEQVNAGTLKPPMYFLTTGNAQKLNPKAPHPEVLMHEARTEMRAAGMDASQIKDGKLYGWYWDPKVNAQWIDKGIRDRAVFFLGASPNADMTRAQGDSALKNPTGRNIYGQEIDQIVAAGYVRAGVFLVPAEMYRALAQ